MNVEDIIQAGDLITLKNGEQTGIYKVLKIDSKTNLQPRHYYKIVNIDRGDDFAFRILISDIGMIVMSTFLMELSIEVLMGL